MKKLIIISIIALLAAIPFSKANAQYTIPAYDVQVTVNTTFEDSGFSQQNQDREERAMTVDVEDEHRGTGSAWAYIVIYQLNGDLSYGPFKVKEGTPFQITLDNELWGVKVTGASEDCSMSVWEE
ncbi:MAG: hypothetical protein GXO86_13195 [Chlorobi bacterium]|nr:hypothetical protein [Chlorobiota bacterium]